MSAPRARQPWTIAEVHDAHRRLRSGEMPNDIARRLGRSRHALRQRMVRMGWNWADMISEGVAARYPILRAFERGEIDQIEAARRLKVNFNAVPGIIRRDRATEASIRERISEERAALIAKHVKQQERKAYLMRINGATFAAIAREMGVSQGTAHNMYRRYMDRCGW